MENLPRPTRPPTARERATDWLSWFGPGRLVMSAVAVLVVCAGAYWLARAPQPPTEASLPRASAGTSPPTLAPPLEPPAPAGPPVTVHVTGAVVRPGVYELPDGARVQSAVDLAGGPTADGDPDAINLAAPAVDGARIYVPTLDEVVAGGIAEPLAVAGPVDVNRASASDLETLPGVGPATAAAIVTERERNGPFLTVDDLDRVRGIGPAKLDALRDLVTT